MRALRADISRRQNCKNSVTIPFCKNIGGQFFCQQGFLLIDELGTETRKRLYCLIFLVHGLPKYGRILLKGHFGNETLICCAVTVFCSCVMWL